MILAGLVALSPLGAAAPPAEMTAPAAPPGKVEEKKEPSAIEELLKAIRFDGQLRLRYEIVDPITYTLATPTARAGTDLSDDFALMRTRLGIEFRPHRKVGARIQIQDSRIWGEEGAGNATQNPSLSAGSAIDRLDLHQAYLDLNHVLESAAGEDAITIRLGRQEMAFGDQRLVSTLEWSNVGRAWDAARLIWTPQGGLHGLRMDVFGSTIRDTASSATGLPVANGGTDQIDDKQEFHGIYASYEFQPAPGWKRKAPGDASESPTLRRHSIDLYGFYRHLADDNIFRNEAGREGIVNEYTLGGLLKGGIAGFDWSAEGAYQTGEWAGDTIDAFGIAVTAGYNLPPALRGGLNVARLGVEYDYGSGDSDPSDGRRGTFDPLFPFGHAYQGWADVFSWKNGQDLAFRAKVELPPIGELNPVELDVDYHLFWLSSHRDAWFNAALNPIRRDPSGRSSSFVGTELDVAFRYNLIEVAPPHSLIPCRVRLWLGYARFFAGEYVEDTGPSPDRDFGFAQIQVDF